MNTNHSKIKRYTKIHNTTWPPSVLADHVRLSCSKWYMILKLAKQCFELKNVTFKGWGQNTL